MMMRRLGWLLLGATSLACSGRYYEVGRMDATGGNQGAAGENRGAAGGAAAGGLAAAGSGASSPGEGDAGPSTPAGIDPQCLTASEPPPLTGLFAEPAVVWGRVARLTWGAAAPPPTDLPATTTYEWASSLSVTLIAGAHTTIGDAPGVEDFLRQLLGLDAAAPFAVQWGKLLPVPRPVLSNLLLTTGAPERVGIFTEESWLAKYGSISARGTRIERALFGLEVPTAPQGIDQSLHDSSLPDREVLERAVSAPVCAACHHIVDPSGFALGHFAADGSYRDLDHGQVIDTTGSRNGDNGSIDFDGIADFGQKFADNCVATLGFSDAFLRSALVINDAPEASREELWQESHARVQQAFISGGRTYIALVTAYIQSPAGLRP